MYGYCHFIIQLCVHLCIHVTKRKIKTVSFELVLTLTCDWVTYKYVFWTFSVIIVHAQMVDTRPLLRLRGPGTRLTTGKGSWDIEYNNHTHCHFGPMNNSLHKLKPQTFICSSFGLWRSPLCTNEKEVEYALFSALYQCSLIREELSDIHRMKRNLMTPWQLVLVDFIWYVFWHAVV